MFCVLSQKCQHLAMFVTSMWHTLHVYTYFGMLKRRDPYFCYGIKYTGGCCYKNGLIRGLNSHFFTFFTLKCAWLWKSTLLPHCFGPHMYSISVLTYLPVINVRYMKSSIMIRIKSFSKNIQKSIPTTAKISLVKLYQEPM